MRTILILVLCSFFCKGFSQKTDTLRVYQNDSSVFNQMDLIQHRPCSKPVVETQYRLIEPKDNTYYYIYNDKKLLVKEGEYTKYYVVDGVKYAAGFYNVKYLFYKKNKELSVINYQEDGRNTKSEFYTGKNEIKSIRYYDKNSGEVVKLELYKNNKLKETRMVTNFYANRYDTIIKHDNKL